MRQPEVPFMSDFMESQIRNFQDQVDNPPDNQESALQDLWCCIPVDLPTLWQAIRWTDWP